jgi:hypothetical protein
MNKSYVEEIRTLKCLYRLQLNATLVWTILVVKLA